jgi:hypothetical protein
MVTVPGLLGVPILTVAPTLPIEPPAVAFEQLDHLPDLHPTRV